MNVLWITLSEDRTHIVDSFETRDADSSRHWDKFFQHRAGTVFCRRASNGFINRGEKVWYVNYFYWEDTTRWGYGPPYGIGWSACLAIPEILKMLEFVE